MVTPALASSFICFESCAERGIEDSGVGYIGGAIKLTKEDIIEVYKLAK